MTTYRIYALLEPDGRDARYVGQTEAHLQQRLGGHLRVRGRSARADWIRSLLASGQQPQIVLLSEVTGTRHDASREEIRWIRRLRADGHPLLNVPHHGDRRNHLRPIRGANQPITDTEEPA